MPLKKSISLIMEQLYSENYQASKNINLLPKCISDLSYNLSSFWSGNLPDKIIYLKLHYMYSTHIYIQTNLNLRLPTLSKLPSTSELLLRIH